MARKVKYGKALRTHISKYNLREKFHSILDLLGDDAQRVLNWAQKEARRRISKESGKKGINLGKLIFTLIGHEAAIRLVQRNDAKRRLTTKSEVKVRTGVKAEMPVLYREAGLRHPQEARNLRHNIIHQAFLALIEHLFPKSTTSIPTTGEGLTPDLIVNHKSPDWTISIEYKGYRSVTLLSESEILKGMRYKAIYGSAWLVTATEKTVASLYGPILNSEKLIDNGLARLRRIARRRAYTDEQRENRGIAKKGIVHLEKQRGINLKCEFVSAERLIESCKAGKPVKGVAITTGFEFIELLQNNGLQDEAENVLKVMKLPTHSLHSDKVTSIRLIG